MTDKILDDYQQRLVRNQLGYNSESDPEDDEILELLDDDFNNNYREQRIQQLSDQFKQSKKQISQEGHGSVETILSEEQILKITTSTTLTVIHFYHDTFDKCKKMNDKLETLAQKHISTKFIRVNVDNAPFLVTRLNIKVLPCVVMYIKGVEAGRIVGFDHLDYDAKRDDFTIESLEKYMLSKGVLTRKAQSYTRLERKIEIEDEESDLDL
ncbi:CYFA0S21e00694g1_1 [Cyberlindnera fabianii]|uniref:CYFA0S21e00694g1_1 n=1 Tax=Cyberlindnera fabianii TaxID=36022 RepID=A0A061B7W7_CYBFA|nr:CYFA0S21e00694g1_1 [Cyberlindnera fabianii]